MAQEMLFFLTGLLSLVFIGSDPAVNHSIIHENVLFYKEGEISLSSFRWILTLVLDIGVYERFIDKLTSDLKMAKNLIVWMSKHYSSDKMAGYLSVFQSLQDQLIMLLLLKRNKRFWLSETLVYFLSVRLCFRERK